MYADVARDVIKAMLKRKLKMDEAKVLVMGFTFKENVPDTRNTKVADLVRELSSFLDVAVYDPVADREDAERRIERLEAAIRTIEVDEGSLGDGPAAFRENCIAC